MQIPNYKIKELIGEGGMATVYLADDDKFKSLVAVKVLKKEFVHNENIRKRFLAEARNLFKMNHPNIIKVTDLVDDGDLVAFVMEYMEGQTLKEYLDTNGKLSDDEIKKLFVQMLDAVGYVHEQGLVHRDIKPGNFMISAKGNVKLLDFGIAKNTDITSSEYTITGTTQNMGTPMYMSPEQIKSTKDVTHQTDIYSLGVVLWQMVAGRKPYDSNELSVPEIQVSILKEELPLTNTMWDDILRAAMQKSVDLRYQNCSMMKGHIVYAEITSTKVSKEVDFDQKTIIDYNDEKNSHSLITASPNDKNETVNNSTKIEVPIAGKRKISPLLFLLGPLLFIVILYLLGKDDSEAPAAQLVDTPVEIEWCEIPRIDTIWLGSPLDEAGRLDNETEHVVDLSAFKMSKYEVTFDQYDAFCDATGRIKPDDAGMGRGKRPVINVNWEDANAFAAWMGCRLPTEAEWEYACRAGTTTPFNTGNNLTTSQANYDGNKTYNNNKKGVFRDKTMPVGSFAPNSWGLYDMHGNVSEWCSDWYGRYPNQAKTNPTGPSSGQGRIIRGGSFIFPAVYSRSAFRMESDPSISYLDKGFRLVSSK